MHGVAILRLVDGKAREIVRAYEDGSLTGDREICNDIRDAVVRGRYPESGDEFIREIERRWNTGMPYVTQGFVEVEDED